MNIEIKKSKKPVEYAKAISFLENRIDKILKNKASELIWILEHPSIYTAGSSYNDREILDKSINLYKTNRGGKITYHGPGQIIFYFAINLNNRKKDIRNLINKIEKTIIETFKSYKINAFADKKNIGIWVIHKKKIKKIAAIGIRVRRWVAYHGFSINVNTDLKKYEKIIPCGINDKSLINLNTIKKQSYKNLKLKLIKNFIKNLKS
tara:strand:+ start:55 stop:675 length:621 start_codon:yes stop_codon:yes gene_type:complete